MIRNKIISKGNLADMRQMKIGENSTNSNHYYHYHFRKQCLFRKQGTVHKKEYAENKIERALRN